MPSANLSALLAQRAGVAPSGGDAGYRRLTFVPAVKPDSAQADPGVQFVVLNAHAAVKAGGAPGGQQQQSKQQVRPQRMRMRAVPPLPWARSLSKVPSPHAAQEFGHALAHRLTEQQRPAPVAGSCSVRALCSSSGAACGAW